MRGTHIVPQAERMAPMSRIRFSSGSPWLINACATRSSHLPPEASTTRATSTTPAASASSSTSRATARTLSSGTRSRSSSTWSTAAPAAARPTPATAPASSSRCRIASSARKRPDCRFRCPPRALRRRPGLPAARTPTRARDGRRRSIERIVGEEGQQLLGWRDVPTDDSALGPRAVAAEPVVQAALRRPRRRRQPTDRRRSSASCT